MNGETDKNVRLLIVDDHPFVRMGISAVLSTDPTLEVVGEAGSGQEAVALCRELRPDVVLMDLSMPGMDGIEATRKIKARFPETRVLVLTGHADEDLLMEALRVGAAGYVLHDANPTRLIEAVRAVLAKETPIDRKMVERTLRRIVEDTSTSG